ncbi:RIIa domain-containing protein 1 [Strongylocentrotus purpuratus]|uniref:RIIa domain-containing protein n=1 Tax=Strongylocentrotus purpuratus TaxID=7668 RepID=A0A7M7G0M4_STRPU|nr:RIIa domain-containing protein 1 [Strongylocentrotus purpuratus]|eukprot:XP_001176667.1 PREDICTED: RIIa domain-containing protein 1 [Strongylocentrotus purpuratus]
MAVPNHNPPQGMEGYDFGALSPEQQEKLNNFKMQTRVANEKYLRDHPEVDILLAEFLRDVLSRRPENIQDFAADWFTKPQLAENIDHQLEQRDASLRDQRFQRKL